MEDRHVVQEGMASCSSCHLLAVFDGHRGPEAAEYAAQHIVHQLQEEMASSDDPAEALAETFVAMDRSFRYASLCTLGCFLHATIRHAAASSGSDQTQSYDFTRAKHVFYQLVCAASCKAVLVYAASILRSLFACVLCTVPLLKRLVMFQ